MVVSEPGRVWTVAEAKARLSEILRLAETEGPQRIGKRSSFVVVPERVWQEHAPPERMPLGQWLVENTPRGTTSKSRANAQATAKSRSSTMKTNERKSPGHQRGLGAYEGTPEPSHR